MEAFVEVRGHCAVLWLGDGENRFTTTYLERINRLLDSILTDEKFSACTTLITTGASRFYSNGIDLDWLTSRKKPEDMRKFFVMFSKTLARFLTFPLLTIAAMNGHAFAGGALLALTHDARIMRHQSGWLCLPEVFLRLPFDRVLSTLLRCKVPPNAVRDFIIFGHRLPAQRALEMQLIDAAIPKTSDIIDEAVKLSRTYLFMDNPRMLNGQYSREGIAMLKEDIYRDVALAFRSDDGNRESESNSPVSSKL